MTPPLIGVLALQGAVELHRPHIEALGAGFRAVKTVEEFEEVDAFILPGGESTTMLKLIERFDLWEALADQFSRKPVWGICAGAILLAERVLNPVQKSFGLLPLSIERNGYGTQINSHHAMIENYEVAFIRAPILRDLDESVHVRARHQDQPVWVEKGRVMATSFHPELTLDYPSPMHRAFLEMLD